MRNKTYEDHYVSTERTQSFMKYKIDKVIREQQMYITTDHSDLERKYVNDQVLRIDTRLTQQ